MSLNLGLKPLCLFPHYLLRPVEAKLSRSVSNLQKSSLFAKFLRVTGYISHAHAH